MNTRKIVFLILVVIVAIVCVGFAGVYTFTRAMYNEKGCEWANIDNIELRTASDIPTTINSDCSFDPTTNTKLAVFQLNMEELDVASFIKNNNYKKYDGADDMIITDMVKVSGELSSDEIYFRADDTEDDSYRMLLDIETGQLWVSIRYKK